jgi:glycosyltransferase involved in cell wall biosynthesis
MKVALVHDWLVVFGGAERVLQEMINIFPEADVYSTVCFLPPDQKAFLQGKTVKTSFIQRLPGAARRYRSYLPLMPLAIEQFDLSEYDLVISSSYAVAKGVITGPDQVHISYVHSPVRYAWDLQHSYLRETEMHKGLKSGLARLLLHYIRMWDVRTSHGPDALVANSKFIARRIKKAYGRDAAVIYPPVDVEKFKPAAGENREDFYLTASRLVPYKRIPLIVEAFRATPERQLVVIGDGPEMNAVRANAGPNIKILGFQPDDVLQSYMQRAKAFVFAAKEDFGITPLEAQASGTPVIAYGRGGALETVRGFDMPNPTGVHFYTQSAEAIIEAVSLFEQRRIQIKAESCRDNAMRFAPELFRSSFLELVQRELRSAAGHQTEEFAAPRLALRR